MKLSDSVALVTGGASGLGSAVVQHFLSEGASVAVFDKDCVDGEMRDNPQVAYFAVDVRDEQKVSDAMNTLISRFGALHICVNCAGIAPAKKVLDRDNKAMSVDLFKQVVDINLVGSFIVSSHAAEHMAQNVPKDGERGLIIQTASIAAYDGQKGQCAYAASKGALASLTLPMARDLASHGIRVVSIAPGVMGTPMMKAMPDEVQDSLSSAIPFPKRMGRPEEFAALTAHLVSNTYINGEVIRMDGGLRMV